MFKLVVLSALLAAAVASPGVYVTPLAYTSTVVAPATTSIVNQASSVIHPSPLFYSRPVYSTIPTYAHLIKKRSAPIAFGSYIAPTTYVAQPFTTTYSAALPLQRTFAAPIVTSYSAPLIRTSPVYTTAHLIKKRSAPFVVPTTYIAPRPYVSTPIISTYAATTPIISSPVVSYSPLAYNHLIKKRSVLVPAVSYAPTAYSEQSRVDIRTSPAVSTVTSYAAPIAYTSHVVSPLI